MQVWVVWFVANLTLVALLLVVATSEAIHAEVVRLEHEILLVVAEALNLAHT